MSVDLGNRPPFTGRKSSTITVAAVSLAWAQPTLLADHRYSDTVDHWLVSTFAITYQTHIQHWPLTSSPLSLYNPHRKR